MTEYATINKIYISGIKHDSIVDGDGFRNVIFVSGCWWNCNGCHNPSTHNPNYGTEYLIDDVVNDVLSDENDITISGGDALTFQIKNTKELIKRIKNKKPSINIWLYTGYKLEDILAGDNQDRIDIVEMCDCIVDGKYIESMNNHSLIFKGSSNQNIWIKNNDGEWCIRNK